MKTFGYVILVILLLRLLQQPAGSKTSGILGGSNTLGNLLVPILAPGSTPLTPDQLSNLNSASQVGIVTGLSTDDSGDLIVNVCPCKPGSVIACPTTGLCPSGLACPTNLGTGKAATPCPSPVVNGIIGGLPAGAA